MSVIFAIDPGTTESGIVELDVDQNEVRSRSIQKNHRVLEILNDPYSGLDVVIEYPTSYGKPVGSETFKTLIWIGRFAERVLSNGGTCLLINRKKIAMTLCRTARASDKEVREACLRRFPATGGGKTPQVGTEKQPGPLIGFANDMWAALAVALAAADVGLHNLQTADSYLTGELNPEIARLADIPLDSGISDDF